MSWSMIALLVSLAGALLLGLIAWVPPLVGHDSGIRPVQPGLLRVADRATGAITLGEGRAVSLDETGMRLIHGTDSLLVTVRGASPLSALIGEVAGQGAGREEKVSKTLSNLTVERVEISPGQARYTGTVGGDGQLLPVDVRVRLAGSRVHLDAAVPGADAVVVHLAEEYQTLGREPVLPGRNLRKRAWWLEASASDTAPAFITALSTNVSIGPRGDGSDRALDLRRPGHTDVHVWSEEAQVSVTSRRLRVGEVR